MNVKTILTLAGSILGSLGIGYFAGRKISEKKYEEQVEALTNDFQLELKKRSKKCCEKPDISTLMQQDVDLTKEEVEELTNTIDTSEADDISNEQIAEAKPSQSVNDLVKKYVEEGVATVKPSFVPNIKIIDDAEYYESIDYTRWSYTYYADGYLTNEQGKVIAKPKELIGEAAMNMLESGEHSVVYIKDEENGAVCEIFYDPELWLDLDGDDSDVGDFADEVSDE